MLTTVGQVYMFKFNKMACIIFFSMAIAILVAIICSFLSLKYISIFYKLYLWNTWLFILLIFLYVSQYIYSYIYKYLNVFYLKRGELSLLTICGLLNNIYIIYIK